MENNKLIDFESLVNVGMSMGAIKEVRPAPSNAAKHYTIVPDGYRVEEIKFSDKDVLSRPNRNVGEVSVATVDSFIRFVERENISGTTVIFSSLDNSSFSAVFNYSKNGEEGGWGDRKVNFKLTPNTNWKRWAEANGRKMSQLAFCDFIEANLGDIVEPAAADIIEMTKQLKIHRKAEFSSIVDPATGFTNLAFSEVISGETRKGDMACVGKIKLALSPFRGVSVPTYSIDANLRFTIEDDNSLRIFFAMINHDITKEHEHNRIAAEVKTFADTLKIPVFDI